MLPDFENQKIHKENNMAGAIPPPGFSTLYTTISQDKIVETKYENPENSLEEDLNLFTLEGFIKNVDWKKIENEIENERLNK